MRNNRWKGMSSNDSTYREVRRYREIPEDGGAYREVRGNNGIPADGSAYREIRENGEIPIDDRELRENRRMYEDNQIDDGRTRVRSIKYTGTKLVKVDALFENVDYSSPFYIFVQLSNGDEPVGSYVFDERDTDVVEINSSQGTVQIYTFVRTIIPSFDNPDIDVLVEFVYKGRL